MADMIRLKAVTREDGSTVVVDQDGRCVDSLVMVKRTCAVEEPVRLVIEVYEEPFVRPYPGEPDAS